MLSGNRINDSIKKLREIVETSRKMVSSGKRISSSVECIYWWLRYHLSRQEYFQFRFFERTNEEKHLYVRDFEVEHDLQRYNDPSESKILEFKDKFDELFSDLLGRDFCVVSSSDFLAFESFVNKHKVFIKKPLDLMCGVGIKRVTVSAFQNLKELFSELTKDGPILLEEVFEQCAELSALNPDTVNTLRLITLRNEAGGVSIPSGIIRIGRKDACVDNFYAGGMAANIDVNTGVITSAGYDQNWNEYTVHPDTNARIKDFQIPEWDQVIAAAKNASDRVPHCRFVGWDIAISKERQICFIEGNHNAGLNINQMLCGYGLRAKVEKGLGKM